MKNGIIAFLVASLLLGCSGNTGKSRDEILQNLFETKKQSCEADGISVEYDSDKQRLEFTSKGDLLTTCYNVTYTDLTGPTPKSYADKFLVSIVVCEKDAQSILSIDFVIEGVKVKVEPYNSEALGNGFVIAGLSTLDKQFCETMQIIQNIVYVEDAFVVTDKGSIRIPAKDIMNLMSMAHSYVLDGGSFEYKY